jgi:hypothetical protein
MLQIADWLISISVIVLLLSLTVYLFYFKFSRKLFPECKNFSNVIEPKNNLTVVEGKGSGILKTIEFNTNETCIVDITIDGASHSLLAVGPDSELNGHIALNSPALAVREQLDEKFHRNWTIHIQNRGLGKLNTVGVVHFETRKGLRDTIKAIFSEF